MSDRIPTRRAIEIVLSRVRMTKTTQHDLSIALAHEIEAGRDAPPLRDADALFAAIMAAEETLTGVSDFPRSGLLARIEIARDTLRAIMKETA